ncbi:hypothetical protein TIFTF001_045729 [Ficus carica]|uniref:Uncharacterized protein n=1 Tax=Ficus carica TaxID=3494 RepID=A0AA87Z051_FICCA|nr:hypothetical protein TIFTF001_045727 [Ficus carica]GMN22909.1 hypothetical protein TIFTF001_045729 [Ficus carica]
MGLFQNLPIVSFFSLLILINSSPSSQATRIEILNNCSDTVWAAANPGGGKKLNRGETWNLTVTAYCNTTTGGRIWGRTNCAFGPDGRGKCLVLVTRVLATQTFLWTFFYNEKVVRLSELGGVADMTSCLFP